MGDKIEKTPICKGLTAAILANPAFHGDADFAGVLCRGSRCHLWVPEITYDEADGSVTVLGARSEAKGYEYGETGRGWCAENMRAVPWEDPAMGGGDSTRRGWGVSTMAEPFGPAPRSRGCKGG